jgi:hypothetical protein
LQQEKQAEFARYLEEERKKTEAMQKQQEQLRREMEALTRERERIAQEKEELERQRQLELQVEAGCHYDFNDFIMILMKKEMYRPYHLPSPPSGCS